MKILYLPLVAILFVLTGCDDPESQALLAVHDWNTRQATLAAALSEDEIEERGEGAEKLVFAKNSDTPYTGWIKAMWNDEDVRKLAQYKDGKRHGIYAEWLDELRMQCKGHYKDGNKEGLWLEWDAQDNETALNYVAGKQVAP